MSMPAWCSGSQPVYLEVLCLCGLKGYMYPDTHLWSSDTFPQTLHICILGASLLQTPSRVTLMAKSSLGNLGQELIMATLISSLKREQTLKCSSERVRINLEPWITLVLRWQGASVLCRWVAAFSRAVGGRFLCSTDICRRCSTADQLQLNSEKTVLCQLGLGCAQTQADGKKKSHSFFSPVFFLTTPLLSP